MRRRRPEGGRVGLISNRALPLFFLSLISGCAVPLEDSVVEAASEASVTQAIEKPKPVVELPVLVPPALSAASKVSEKEYTFAYWRNGWRKLATDASPDIFCIETGKYGFSLDLADFSKAEFGLLDDAGGYEQALQRSSMALDTAKLDLSIKVGDDVYRAMSCKAGNAQGTKSLQDARMWDSGRLVQYFDLLGLVFENNKGEQLACNGKLELTAWPNALTLSAAVTPGIFYKDGAHVGVNGNGVCVVTKPVILPHQPEMEHEQFSLEAWVKLPREFEENNKGYLVSKNGSGSSKGFFGFSIDEGIVSAVMNTAGGRDAAYAMGQKDDAFVVGEWNHLALCYDGDKMFFYINGALQGKRSIKNPRTKASGKMFLGGGPHNHSKVAQGVYDQVLIWNRALPAEEVKRHAEDARKMENREGLVFKEFFSTEQRLKGEEVVWENAQLSLALTAGTHEWMVEQPVAATWSEAETKKLTLNCTFRPHAMPYDGLNVVVDPKDAESVVAQFDADRNCYIAEVEKLKRSWKTGYTDIRNYDEFTISVNNPSEEELKVPLLLFLRDVANITGLVPMLCDAEGKPTGVPVQLSKNWHYSPFGSYLRSYMLVPAAPGENTYTLRIAYGFYGTLPSASHAQLSLVGYGGNGRWDQLAIGCWGETICFDMDMSCVDISVTDVRLLMARVGLDGQKWGWTDAGWGGDWLNAQNDQGGKLYPTELKTAYIAHGPCLTEVKHDGKYGAGREIDLATTIRTLRTDDYARTFQQIKYEASAEATLEDGWLYKVGRTGSAITPKVAYGNRAGLIKEIDVPQGVKRGDLILDREVLTGEGPWWISFPAADTSRPNSRGHGTRALIIRSYDAIFNGEAVEQPSISLPVYQTHKGGQSNVDILVMPPKGVSSFLARDSVEMDIEWMTLPVTADDYYGPNEAFRSVLTEHPESWQPVYREVLENELSVVVKGGVLNNRYPVIVQAQSPQVEVRVEGGVGAVPIRFDGLHAATGYTLYQKQGAELLKVDQSVHGNDFWQTDYDAFSNTWRRTYNVPMDNLPSAVWVLKQDAP